MGFIPKFTTNLWLNGKKAVLLPFNFSVISDRIFRSVYIAHIIH